mgnify:CR=1 FL=1
MASSILCWLMAISEHPFGPRTLPRLGCSRPDLGLLSVAFVNNLTVWERIREFDIFDTEANQKLATNYQKLKKFTLSEQAASRALKSAYLRDWDRAETYALIGSNYKTQWHATVESETGLSKRQRKALMSPFLGQSYNAYHDGFECHRSHYYSGLNAVAMLSIQIELARLHPDQWVLDFSNDRYAELELEERSEHLTKLIAATDLAGSIAWQGGFEPFGTDWQESARADASTGGLSGEMTRSDAYAILGLEEGSSREQIIAAHGRLIQRLHPDRGGSTFLAAKINQARDLLLGA